MTNNPNHRLSVDVSRSGQSAFSRGLRQSAFALAFSGVIATTAFAANVATESDYVADITSGATTTTVSAPITFTGPIPPAVLAPNFSLVGASTFALPVLDGSAATGSALMAITQIELIQNLEFTGFTSAGNDGGAILAGDLVMRLEDVRFANNATTGNGGAVAAGWLGNGISNAAFIDNTAGASGGALVVANTFAGGITDSLFQGNQSGANGNAGAVAVNSDFSGNITNSTFRENSTGGNAGAVAVLGNFTGSIVGSTFEDNEAGSNAGALLVFGNFTGDIEASSFKANSSNASGGAIALNGDFTGDIVGATFEGNTANNSGGGIALGRDFTGNITGSTFENNTATNGAAFSFDGDFTGAIQDSRFVGNKVTNHGGAIAGGLTAANQFGQSPDISGSTFIGNEANGTLARGGALAINGSSKLTDNTFLKNSASTTGTDLRNGTGGAVHHNTRTGADSTLEIESTAGSRTLFYGNTHGPGGSAAVENGLYFTNRGANNTRSTLTLNITGEGDLLLFDGLFQDALTVPPTNTSNRARVTVNVNKDAASTGAWYLGGRSEFREESTWAIDGGSLILTNVDYGSGVVGASLTLSGTTGDFSLGADATLGGNGTLHTVAGGFALDGALAPATWANTGTLASDITNGISAADIAAIGVEQTSTLGKLTIEGDTTLGATAVYKVDARVDGSGADSIEIVGTGTIDAAAKVELSLEPGAWNGPSTYTILSANGGLGGTEFSALAPTTDYLFLNVALSYPNANDVALSLTRNGNFATVGATPNQVATGVAINGLSDANPVIVSLMGLTNAADAQAAFDSLSGEIYSSTGTALLQASSHVRDLVAARLFEAETSGRQRGVWGTVYGYDAKLDGSSNVAQVQTESFGFAVGGDIPLPFGDSGNVGVLLGYEDADVKSKRGHIAKSEVETFNIGTYFGTSFNGFQIRAGLAHSRHDIDTARDVRAGTLSGRNLSSYDATLTQVFGELAYPVRISESLEVTPYGGLQQLWLDVDGALERGTEATLRTRDWKTDVTRSQAGLRFKTADLDPSEEIKFFVHGDLGWSHAFNKEDGRHARRFENTTEFSSDFSVRGARLADDLFVVGLGVSAEIGTRQVVGLDYKGEFSGRETHHGGKLHWSFKF